MTNVSFNCCNDDSINGAGDDNTTIVWNPLIKASCINKQREYLIDPDDFIDKMVLTPFTVFDRNGELIRISGLRLYILLTTTAPLTTAASASTKNVIKKSKKNICFKNCNLIETLLSKLKMPPCIQKLIQDLSIPRGGAYRKRFIVNCYISNLVSCTKCNNMCLLEALTQFYQGDSKCVHEVTHLIVKSQNAYMPPNCHRMKTVDKLCPYVGKCKGLNPVCNF
ncbi:lef-2 [Cyclophragma undans nucleopolyhedrovirus]|uniref:Lef-2 n=1 Tax=Cyclophragma undans nucleopolyhedrovirus TaxID=1906244 RepID=A0A288QYV9_9ABAC|nr:lef-2 [Cyclophragma undans nucleopolyhedrovirus]AOT85604.1 lef-2 [Cyclophragma undans nucleopolyhedrovirus]